LRALWNAGIVGDFEILCYTPEEFERKKKSLGIVREALREGIVVNPNPGQADFKQI